ncbi:MAG: Uma2 family endonuclease [Candidatus Bipolaricaulota bacterium]|nr:Uma2 family endonuclease [Candidatus Bipolaricaulota bacterium]MCS7274538.1 Uma2 family endonuclease [Candidatus Bipolaricaulota bacterium]MDW8111217.1 Uma2 family endonuclease [Candidatus Bipolaricaulota bacterium]MDW8329452.1 Uma2 family endonuclease [Candidatus Bipolaricaulota bacterium]
MAESTKTKLNYEEFLKLYDEDTRAEWVDGEVILLSPASNRHQDLVRFLTVILDLYVEKHDLGVIRPAPFQMKLGLSGREPDLLFVAKEHLERLQENYLDGPADLVIEIISPESRLRDRGEKLAEYELAGVREYWLLDPDEKRADFYLLGDDGRYDRRRPQPDGRYRSEVLAGFVLDTNWLWRSPLPPVLSILQELKLF